jgi:hypothetical protein
MEHFLGHFGLEKRRREAVEAANASALKKETLPEAPTARIEEEPEASIQLH